MRQPWIFHRLRRGLDLDGDATLAGATTCMINNTDSKFQTCRPTILDPARSAMFLKSVRKPGGDAGFRPRVEHRNFMHYETVELDRNWPSNWQGTD